MDRLMRTFWIAFIMKSQRRELCHLGENFRQKEVSFSEKLHISSGACIGLSLSCSQHYDLAVVTGRCSTELSSARHF